MPEYQPRTHYPGEFAGRYRCGNWISPRAGPQLAAEGDDPTCRTCLWSAGKRAPAGPMARARCPECGHLVAVRKNGRFRVHRAGGRYCWDGPVPAPDVNLTERPEDTLRRYAGILVALGKLHEPYSVYDEIDHDLPLHDPYEPSNWPEGHARVETRDFVTCEAMFLHLICAHCCLDAAGEMTEECATSHDHGRDKPRCPTAAILDGDDHE